MQRGCRAEPQLNDDNEHNLFEFDGAHANAIVRGLAVKAFLRPDAAIFAISDRD
jgi:hypothetical protein